MSNKPNRRNIPWHPYNVWNYIEAYKSIKHDIRSAGGVFKNSSKRTGWFTRLKNYLAKHAKRLGFVSDDKKHLIVQTR